MLYNLYAIKDEEAVEFGELLNAKNDKVAIRMFDNVVKQNHLDRAVFGLYRMGTYDTETGKIKQSFKDPVCLRYSTFNEEEEIEENA